MDRAKLDAAYNNGAAVKNSAQIVADWQARSARIREQHPDGLDLRYGPSPRNRIDFFEAKKDSPLLVFIHGGYWQMREKETFTFIVPGPLALRIPRIAGSSARWAPSATRPRQANGASTGSSDAQTDEERHEGLNHQREKRYLHHVRNSAARFPPGRINGSGSIGHSGKRSALRSKVNRRDQASRHGLESGLQNL